MAEASRTASAREAEHALALVSRSLEATDALASRTEGVTWMLWGFVLAGVFATFAGAGPLFETAPVPLWAFALWVPWVLVGAGATWGVWRSAALRVPVPTSPLAAVGLFATWGAGILAGFALLGALPAFRNPDATPLIVVGFAWGLLAGVNAFRASPLGRRVLFAIGGVTLVTGLVLSFALPPVPWGAPGADVTRVTRELTVGAIAGLVPFVAGLWQSLKG